MGLNNTLLFNAFHLLIKILCKESLFSGSYSYTIKFSNRQIPVGMAIWQIYFNYEYLC